MSLVEEILTILASYSGGYKLIRKKMMGYSSYSPSMRNGVRKIKEDSLKTTLSRLKKRGLIESEGGIWGIKRKGREYLKNKLISKVPHFRHLKSKNNNKKIIVIFDIPEKRKNQRNWLRGELMALDFTLLQKSVWLGPALLPKEFIKYLNKVGLLPCLKFFKATEEDVV